MCYLFSRQMCYLFPFPLCELDLRNSIKSAFSFDSLYYCNVAKIWVFRPARRTVLKLFENIFNCFDLFLDICIYIKNPIPLTWDHKCVLLTPSCGYPKLLHSTDKCKCILSLGSKIISARSCNIIACKMQSWLLISF